MSKNDEFRISLRDEDWNPTVGGWTSEALTIPGIKVVAIYCGGRIATPDEYLVSKKDIRWRNGGNRPAEILVEIELTKDLNEIENRKIELEKEKIQLEQEKVQLEHSKFKLDRNWKLIGALLTFLGIVVGSATTYYISSKKCDPPRESSSPLSLVQPPLPSSSPIPSPGIPSTVTLNKSSDESGKTNSSTPSPSPTSAKPSPGNPLSSTDWLVCWHGKQIGPERIGYEYLIAYPPGIFQGGLDLGIELAIEPGKKPDTIANDSLKMCYLKGQWYGGNGSSKPWFPNASYLEVKQGQILLSTNVFGQGESWTITPGSAPPSSIMSLYKEPSGDKRVYVLNSRKTDSSGN
jgi:hypothetical protein